MKDEFVMRGQTASGLTETLNFGGHKDGYGFLLTEFQLYPAANLGGTDNELFGTVTAGKTAVAPIEPNFNDEGLIAVCAVVAGHHPNMQAYKDEIVNDTFVITQDLILMVQDTGGAGNPINWQCRFKPVKLDTAKQALTNYRQFMIFDE